MDAEGVHWIKVTQGETGTVLVEDNRIAAVGAASEITVPEGAFVLDVTGKTIIPGLVDAHAHGAMARS